MGTEDSPKQWPQNSDTLTYRIIGAAIEAHRCLGPGCWNPRTRSVPASSFPFAKFHSNARYHCQSFYKSITLLRAYKPDLLVNKEVIVELKTIDKILSVHEVQLLTYLKLSGFERGLLVNFNSVPLVSGIRRLNKADSSPVSLVSADVPAEQIE